MNASIKRIENMFSRATILQESFSYFFVFFSSMFIYFFANHSKSLRLKWFKHSNDDISILLRRDSICETSDRHHLAEIMGTNWTTPTKILDQKHYFHFRRGFNPNNLYFRACRGLHESKTCSFVSKLHEIDDKRARMPSRWKSLPDKLNSCSKKQHQRLLKSFVKLIRARSKWLEKAQLASVMARATKRRTIKPTTDCNHVATLQKRSLWKLVLAQVTFTGQTDPGNIC